MSREIRNLVSIACLIMAAQSADFLAPKSGLFLIPIIGFIGYRVGRSEAVHE